MRRIETFEEFVKTRLNEDYMTQHIVPGYQMEVGGKWVEVLEVTDFQLETAWRIIVRDTNTGVCYRAVFNGHMYIMGEEVECPILSDEVAPPQDPIAVTVVPTPRQFRVMTKTDLRNAINRLSGVMDVVAQ